MTDWFTADWHFNHPTIIKYCDRPYKTERKMKEDIIAKFNEVVNEDDTTYVIGDVGMYGRDKLAMLKPILAKMNGRKHLILGNHDEGKPFTYERMGFTTVHTALQYNKDIFLRHDPAAANVAPNKIWFVGHVHNVFHITIDPIVCYNVGVDVNGFYPVSFEQIMLHINDCKQNKLKKVAPCG